jgi:hypothetical protein
MDRSSLLRVCVPLCVLGFATTVLATVSIAGVLRFDSVRYYLLALYLVLGAATLFFAWFRNASALSRAAHIALGLVDAACAVAAPLTPFAFHDGANYLSRVAYFQFLGLGILGSAALFWPYATRVLGRDALADAGAEPPQEGFLYVVWALVVGLVVPWFIPLKESYYREVLFQSAVVNTVGFWFFGAALAGALGVGLLAKGTGGPVGGYAASNK